MDAEPYDFKATALPINYDLHKYIYIHVCICIYINLPVPCSKSFLLSSNDSDVIDIKKTLYYTFLVFRPVSDVAFSISVCYLHNLLESVLNNSISTVIDTSKDKILLTKRIILCIFITFLSNISSRNNISRLMIPEWYHFIIHFMRIYHVSSTRIFSQFIHHIVKSQYNISSIWNVFIKINVKPYIAICGKYYIVNCIFKNFNDIKEKNSSSLNINKTLDKQYLINACRAMFSNNMGQTIELTGLDIVHISYANSTQNNSLLKYLNGERDLYGT